MKRNRIWPYLGIGAIAALILALVLVALPAGAATSGNVQGVQGDLSVLSDTVANDGEAITWASPNDGAVNSFVIHLEDSDLDVAASVEQDIPDCTGTFPNTPVVLASQNGSRVPVLDGDGDGRITASDVDIVFLDSDDDPVTPTPTYVSVATVNGPDGIITLQCTAAQTFGVESAQLKYDTSSIDTTFSGSTVIPAKGTDTTETNDDVPAGLTGGGDTVTVSSQTDSTGIEARLIETRRDSGVFELEINLCAEDSCSSTDGRLKSVTEEKDLGADNIADGQDENQDSFRFIKSGEDQGFEIIVRTRTHDGASPPILRPLATSSISPSDVSADVEDIVVRDSDGSVTSRTERPYLEVTKVDSKNGMITLATTQDIPPAAKSVRVDPATTVTGTTIQIPDIDNSLAKFDVGDIISIRAGAAGSEGTEGPQYRVTARTFDDTTDITTITIDRDLDPVIDTDGALVVDAGISFSISYTIRTDFDADNAGTNDPLKTRGEAQIEVDPDTGDVITIVYDDPKNGKETMTISVETTPPTISELSDSSDGAGGDDTPTFFAEVTDQGSEITEDTDDEASIKFVFMLMELDGDPETRRDVLAGPHSVERDDFRDEDEITDGFRVEAEFNNKDLTTTDEEYEIHWWVVAKDIAGNTGVSDAAAENDDGDPDPCTASGFGAEDNERSRATLSGCDPFIVRVDTKDPQLDKAITGNWWDAGADRGKELQTGAAASLTSVMVIFSEPMNGASFDTSDFRVGGNAPDDVDWYDAPDQGVPTKLCISCAAFLTISDPLDSNDKPRVQVVGAVSDKSGNVLDEANLATADDGIAAALTVTVTGTAMTEDGRPVTNEVVTVNVTSDEPLRGRPDLDIRKVVRGNTTAFVTADDPEGGSMAATGTQEWEMEVDLAAEGLYNVYVTAIDRGGTETTSGVAPTGEDDDGDPIGFGGDSITDDAPMLIEVDTGIPQPAFIPAHRSADTDNPDVLLRINFSKPAAEDGMSEADEYGAEAQEAQEFIEEVKAAAAVLDDETTDDDESKSAVKAVKGQPEKKEYDEVNFDTYATVSLVSVTFDGPGYDNQDVTDMFFTRDDVVFSWRPGDLAVGEYSITVTAMDEAGNEEDLDTATFEIVSPAPYSLPVDPGVNLISLPGNPVNMDINEVIPTDGTIDLVTTYDPEAALGPWLVATWNSDTGLFEGTLTTIDSKHAYWVRASTPITLSVLLQRQAEAGVTPPTIAVSAGWNLVPVVDLTRSTEGTEISAAAYFAGVEWSLAYTYNAEEARWVRIPNIPPPAEGAKDPEGVVRNVEVGKGYWLWATEAGTIVP